jgi:hypothetical protein
MGDFSEQGDFKIIGDSLWYSIHSPLHSLLLVDLFFGSRAEHVAFLCTKVFNSAAISSDFDPGILLSEKISRLVEYFPVI